MTKYKEIVRKLSSSAVQMGLTATIVRNKATRTIDCLDGQSTVIPLIHVIYDIDGLLIPIPRHREVGDLLTLSIYRQAAVKLGDRWWEQ